MVECLSSMHRDLGLVLNTAKQNKSSIYGSKDSHLNKGHLVGGARVAVKYYTLHRTVPQRKEELPSYNANSTRTEKVSSRATPKDRKQRDIIKKPTKRDGEMACWVRCWVYEREDTNLIPRTQLK